MGPNRRSIWMAMALACLLCPQADARLVESWSFQRLKDAADAVVVVTVASEGPWNEKVEDGPFGKYLEGRLTTFDVETVFKGEVSEKQVQVIHFRENGGVLIDNGPLLASFRKMGLRLGIESVDGVEHKAKVEEGMPHYLLFLKKRSDGKYEPVSGQIDSLFSVRRLSQIDQLFPPRETPP